MSEELIRRLIDTGVLPILDEDTQAIVARAIEATNITLYETALRKLQNAAAAYVHPERRISAEELIDLLLATVDDGELVRALRGDETPPDPERNTMAWMERCFPDLAAEVRSGKTSFSEAYPEAMRRSLNATSKWL